ncbi:MAG: hypothetical protein HZB42_15845 [Sphingobacteriales bacterium]|nr:hypothetical protein [Sphingobacteriales bacterium]
MKKWFSILILFLTLGFASNAQNEEPVQQEGRIQEKMREYIQNKLSLSKNEAERFTPVFIRYFREFAQTHREFRGDNLILKQKIIELRIRYRTEFRQVLDEQRANKVYIYEDDFRQRALEIIKETRRARMENKPFRRNRAMFQ